MKCKNCKADNKQKSICDAGIACYVLRCGEYGCALNGKMVDRLLRMKKYATNADRIRAMTDEELVKHIVCQWAECKNMDVECDKCLLEWLKMEAQK